MLGLGRRKPQPKRYWGGVYEIEGYDHNSLVRRDMFGNLAPRIKIVWLYVGQTRQKFAARWKEHAEGSKHWKALPKEWWDLVIKCHEAIERPDFAQYELDDVELVRINKRLTQYNVEHNRNPDRIKPGKDHEVWKAQRAERDALGGTAYLVKLAKARQRRNRWWCRWLFREETIGHIKLATDEDSGTWEVTQAFGPALDWFWTEIEEARR